ncbi:CvpA family protein [Halomonas sp. WWR20]
MTLTWLDWAFLLVLTVSMLTGFLRGLVREALGLATWIVALLAARLFALPVGNMLEGFISHPDVRLVLGFVLVIFGVVMVCGFVIRLINAAVEWVGMGFFNRVAGSVFGALRGAAVLVLVTIVISLTPLSEMLAWRQAELRPAFEELRNWSVSRLETWEGMGTWEDRTGSASRLIERLPSMPDTLRMPPDDVSFQDTPFERTAIGGNEPHP